MGDVQILFKMQIFGVSTVRRAKKTKFIMKRQKKKKKGQKKPKKFSPSSSWSKVFVMVGGGGGRKAFDLFLCSATPLDARNDAAYARSDSGVPFSGSVIRANPFSRHRAAEPLELRRGARFIFRAYIHIAVHTAATTNHHRRRRTTPPFSLL